MKIVVGATAHPLPATDGMRLHVRHVLRHLRDRHDITLVSQPSPGDDTSPGGLDEICSSYVPVTSNPSPLRDNRIARELVTLVSGRSKVLDETIRSGLGETLERVVREVRPDVVHLETGAAAAFAGRLDAPIVVVPLDADDLNAEAYTRYAGGAVARWFAAREARRWKRFEQQAYAACDAVVLVGERDAEMLRRTDSRLDPVVIPNGVDTDDFTPPDGPRDSDVVVLHGAMDYPPNVDAAVFAATEILPELHRLRPDARLVLAGRNPDERVRSLAGSHVEVTGEMPDLRPVLRSASVYLCPMRLGSGIKNKLLEAFACGCPTVATALATNGMGTVAGRDLLVAEDARGLASALAELLEDPHGRAAELGRSARLRAEALSWEATARSFEDLYRDVAERRR